MTTETDLRTAHSEGDVWQRGRPRCGVGGTADPRIVDFPEDVTCKACFAKEAKHQLVAADVDRMLSRRISAGEVTIDEDDHIHFRDWPADGFSAAASLAISKWLGQAVEITQARERRREHVERYAAADRPDPDECTHSVCVRGWGSDQEYKCSACKQVVKGGRFVDMGREFRRYEE